jgi:hypothetical protein
VFVLINTYCNRIGASDLLYFDGLFWAQRCASVSLNKMYTQRTLGTDKPGEEKKN